MLKDQIDKFLMRHKSTFTMINVFVAIAVMLSLQGCSRTPPTVNRALLIATSTNQDDNIAIPNAADDVEGFGETLSSTTKIPSKNLRVLTPYHEPITRETVLNELHEFADQTNQNDVALLTIEGRSIEINGENYFYTSTSTPKQKTPTKETLIGMQDILQAVNGMQAKELIITLAHNADALPSYASEFSVPLSESQWDVDWKIPSGVRSVVAFHFSGSEQSVPKFPLANAFTYFLAKGLGGGAADQNGEVKVGNLLHYTQLGVASSILMYGGNIETCAWSIASTNKQEVLNTVLAKNLPPGSGGESTVSLPLLPTAKRKSDDAVLRGFELQTEIEQRLAENGNIKNAIKSHTLPQLIRTSFAPVRYQFLEAVRLDPDSPMANYELGRIEMKMGDMDNAQKYFEKAIKLAPKSSSAVWRIANLMQHEKKYQQAEALYKRAISLAPNNAMIKYDLSTSYTDNHEFNKANTLLKEIIKDNPTWDAPLDQMSYIEYANGNKAKAIGLLQRAYKLNPDNTDVLYKLAWNHCHTFKSYQTSEQLYRKLIKLSPENGLYRKEFAECLLQENNMNEAKSQAKKAIDLGYPTNDPLFKKLKLN